MLKLMVRKIFKKIKCNKKYNQN